MQLWGGVLPKGRFVFTCMWKICFSTVLFLLSLSILVSTFFPLLPENQWNCPSWDQVKRVELELPLHADSVVLLRRSEPSSFVSAVKS